ncbi:MAG TPA: endolytic transglycosylase MltG [Polyangiaceae bacterium]|nr:endolytic transglycosylase MltG [Polyangiaceae bacterium]
MKARGKGPKRRRRRSRPAAGPPTPTVEHRPRRPALARWALFGLAVATFAASAWFFVLYPAERAGGQGRSVHVSLARDPSPNDLAAALAAAGLVSNPRLFALWVRATGGAHRIAEGSHLLTDDASPRELMARLERRPGGGSARVTFPEGWTRFDMARRLQDKHIVALRDFLDATTDATLLRELGIDGDSAEGFLFPATYDFSLDDEPRDVVRRMKREFDRRWDTVSRAHSASLSDVMTSAKLSVRDVVTLASLVEKEAALDDERPIIASVFLNRLRDPAFKPRRLECDPTAAYGCLVFPEKAASCAVFTGKPTAAMEHDGDNPYSTYTHEGLPPGPIANAGERSVEAAMNPAATHFFYFVARGEGRHAFSETYEAHLAAIRSGTTRR